MELHVNLSGYEDIKITLNHEGLIQAYHFQSSRLTLNIFNEACRRWGLRMADWPLEKLSEIALDGKSLENNKKGLTLKAEDNVEEKEKGAGLSKAQLLRSLGLLEELVLKSQGVWDPPHKNKLICDCRQVTATTIDQAILAGAGDLTQISSWTTACTSCTTCKDAIEEMISYRQKNKRPASS